MNDGFAWGMIKAAAHYGDVRPRRFRVKHLAGAAGIGAALGGAGAVALGAALARRRRKKTAPTTA